MKHFIKNKENFNCENCGKKVFGDGYTNHCPYCLYSKHVDVFPGDRDDACGGIMEPIKIENKNGSYIILHKCVFCRKEKRNKSQENDSFDVIVSLC